MVSVRKIIQKMTVTPIGRMRIQGLQKSPGMWCIWDAWTSSTVPGCKSPEEQAATNKKHSVYVGDYKAYRDDGDTGH